MKNNIKDINSIIEEKIINFQQKLQRMSNFDICIENIKKIKIKIENVLKNIEEIAIIENNERGNILIKPINKEYIKDLENIIKKNYKNNSIIINKNIIELFNQNIITIEEKKRVLRLIKEEKEKLKIIIRDLRRKNNKIYPENEQKNQKIINDSFEKIEKIFNEKIKSIK